MAEIGHAFTEQNSRQTRTGATSYADISGASITAASLTAGKQYLLLISAQMDGSLSSDTYGVKTIHGSTDFADSEHRFRVVNAAPFAEVYVYFTVWTAVTGEDVKLQFATLTSTGNTVGADQIAMCAINLTDDLTEDTDWFFATDGGDLSLTTTPQTGASITFTPGTASHDWLVLTNSQIQTSSTADSSLTLMDRSGEATSSVPSVQWEVNNATESTVIMCAATSRVFTLGAASNTLREQSGSTPGNAGTRLFSSVFAINLNSFKNHSFAYTEADAALSTTNYATTAQSLTITPTVAGDVLFGLFFGTDKNNGSRETEMRLQIDSSDVPAGQTTDNYQFAFGRDTIDEEPNNLFTLVADLSAAEHTAVVHCSADSATGSPAIQHRSLWAFTMELAGATAYTLNAEAGSYAVTGAALTALANRLINAAAGSYVLTGSAATLTHGFSLNAESGSYGVTGAAVTVLADRLINAEAGAYTLTGLDATLAKGYFIVAEAGSYIVTGAAASLLKDSVLNAEAGSHVITGAAASLIADRLLNLEAGSYQIIGADAELLYAPVGAYELNAEPGIYEITGAAASLLAGRVVNAESGAYAVTGANASLIAERLIAALAGQYNVTGADANLLADRKVNAESGTYTITGADAAILADRLLNAEAGAYQVTGFDAELVYVPVGAYELNCEPGVYSITGAPAGLVAAYLIVAESGSYVITGEAATLLTERVLNAESGSYAIDGKAALLFYLSTAPELGLAIITDILLGRATLSDITATTLSTDSAVNAATSTDRATTGVSNDSAVGSATLSEAPDDD